MAIYNTHNLIPSVFGKWQTFLKQNFAISKAGRHYLDFKLCDKK